MEWFEQAACRGKGDLFFAPPGERPPSRLRREAQAVALCKTCPVASECGRYAEAQAEEYGIWAGVSRGL